MKILVIGSDPKLFNQQAESFSRIRGYADFLDKLYIISMTGPGFSPLVYNNRLFIYPTNSTSLILRWYDAWRLALRAVSKYKFDLIDAQDAAEAGLAALLTARSSGIPLRIQIHTDIFNPIYQKVSWKEKARYYLANYTIPRADCLRVVSRRIRTNLELAGVKTKGNIVQLPIYTDVSKFVHGEKNPEMEKRFADFSPRLISAGRFIDKEKNFSMLIRISAQLIRRYPKLCLAVVGEGKDKKYYQQLIQKLGIEKNVFLLPWQENLDSLFKSFDIFVLPSNYEGWGRVIIEAMASGLAVVMTNTGLAGEVLIHQQNGLVVPVGNKKAMMEAIDALLQNLALRRKLAAAAVSWAREYAVKKEDYLRKYKEALISCILSVQDRVDYQL